MGHIHIAAQIPVVGNLIAQLGIAVVLLETHVGAVTVGAVVRGADEACEFPFAYAVGHLALQGVERAVSQVDVGLYPLFAHPAGNDIDYPAHGVRPIEYRSRAAQYFHPFGQERLVGVGDRVTEDAGILWVAVDEYHQSARASTQSAQGYTPGSSVGNTVAHDSPRGDEEAGNLLGEYGQYRGLHALLYLLAVDDRDGEGQMPHIGLVAGAGHDHFADVNRVGWLPGHGQVGVIQ